MNTPSISILLPFFQVKSYFEEALKSIQNQTFTDWECILIDDGSTD